jgi:Domain of unknown function (DUF4390)
VRPRVILATLLFAVPAAAQGGPKLEIALPSRDALATEGPRVRAVNVLSEPTVRDLLNSGFPARLHFRVELWSSGGLFNAMRESAEWDVVVSYDALGKRYRLVRLNDGHVVSSLQFVNFGAALTEAERPYRVPISARHQRDRQYYNAILDVETMSLGDLDELQHWLHGELQPAVRGQRNPGTAIGRGLRELFARLLGADRRSLEIRSRTFQVP